MPQFRSKYHGRYSGIGSMMQRPWLQRAVRRSAVEMKGLAEANSPQGDPAEDAHSGLYRDSFHIVPLWKNVPFKGKPRMRAGARLINVAPHARIVEYGNGKTPAYAVLTRTIDEMTAAHRGS